MLASNRASSDLSGCYTTVEVLIVPGGHASAALLRVDGAPHSSEGGRSTAAAISREAEAEQLPAESTALQHEPLAASGRTSGGGGARAQHRVHGELSACA